MAGTIESRWKSGLVSGLAGEFSSGSPQINDSGRADKAAASESIRQNTP